MGSIELLGFKINIKWLRKIPAVTGSNLKTLHNKIQTNCYKNHFLLKLTPSTIRKCKYCDLSVCVQCLEKEE